MEKSVKIELSLVDDAARKALGDFVTGTRKVDDALKKTGKAGSDSFSQISVAIGKSIGVYDIFVGNLAANLATKAIESIAAAAEHMFQVFIVDGVRAASEAETAQTALNQALAQTGQYSEATSDRLEQLAKDLSVVTGVEDDLIVKNMALIQNLAALDEQGLSRATEAALDLQAALSGKGVSLEAASEALSKAANGNVTALQRMGIEVRKGATDAQTFANALEAVNARFGGSAAAQQKTFQGSLNGLSNSFNNLQESIGNLIVQNPAVINAMNAISKVLQDVTDDVNDAGPSLKIILGESLVFAANATAFTVIALERFIAILQSTFGQLQRLQLPIVGLIGVYKALTQGIDEATNYIEGMNRAAEHNRGALGRVNESAEKVATAFIKVGQSAESGLKQTEAGLDSANPKVKNLKDNVKGVSDELESAKARLKSFTEELVKQGEKDPLNSDGRLAKLEADSEAEREILRRKFEQNEMTYLEFQARQDELDAEIDARRTAIEEERYQRDQERLEEALELQAVTPEQYLKAREQLEINYENNKEKRQADIRKRDLKQEEETQKAKRRLQQAQLQATADMFGALADLTAASSKDNFELVKAFQIAQAITSGILAVQNALAQVPYPANILAAAAMGVQTAANVIRIANTQPPAFAGGGVVGGFQGATSGPDNQVIQARTGEMILNAQQQRNLFDRIDSGNGSNREFIVMDSRPIVVTVDGKELFNAVRDEMVKGRTLAS